MEEMEAMEEMVGMEEKQEMVEMEEMGVMEAPGFFLMVKARKKMTMILWRVALIAE